MDKRGFVLEKQGLGSTGEAMDWNGIVQYCDGLALNLEAMKRLGKVTNRCAKDTTR